jgi:ubiquinone/menaquinone biosynthesis C-methylase UbiE
MTTSSPAPGRLIEGAFRYDVKLWARSLGRERAFRRELAQLARLAPGESVLDLGCGTGTQAIVAKRRVGPTGLVHGIDPSPEMIARARRKASRAGVAVEFASASAQGLPFSGPTFDAVMATLTLHHLGGDGLHRAVDEIRRVLKPGGRLLAADIDLNHPANPRGAPHAHAHRVGAHFDLSDIASLLTQRGFELVESGPVAFRFVRFERMRYVLAALTAGPRP